MPSNHEDEPIIEVTATPVGGQPNTQGEFGDVTI